jgi:L-ascorbate metabolism protein UlaG (beta-lactamase superfamily)
MAAAAAGALSCRSLPTICSCSSALTKNSLRSVVPSAFSSVSSLGLTVSHWSTQVSSNRSCAWCEFPSSVMNSNYRRRTTAAVQGSTTEGAVKPDESLSKTASPLTMTYLEGNSWLWEIMGLKILVDPVLIGNLDFGIPWLYDGAKITYKDFKLEDLPELDYLLISQGYDDHCHEKTIGPLSQLMPDLKVIASPNAQPILRKYFKNVTYLEPTGESTTLKASSGTDVVIRASAGPILGPPWQRPENGYFIEVKDPKFSIYYEPHCVFENAKLEQEQADVVVTPVIKQVASKYTFVSGQEDAVNLAQWLDAKYIVTMKNGELNTTGILSKLVYTEGTTESFQEMLAMTRPNVKVLQPTPGVPLEVPVA